MKRSEKVYEKVYEKIYEKKNETKPLLRAWVRRCEDLNVVRTMDITCARDCIHRLERSLASMNKTVNEIKATLT